MSEARNRRAGWRTLPYAALAYGVLGAAGTLLDLPVLHRLTSEAAVFVPAGAFFLSALAYQVLRIQRQVAAQGSGEQLVFHEDIGKTYGSMRERLGGSTPKQVWATYLNPEAFVTGRPPDGLADYYDYAERLDVADYRRVFGIYPDRPEHRAKREKTIEWLRGHRERTRGLNGYEARYVELDFQAAEVLADDTGLNFSFPSERATEAGWATLNPDIDAMMKRYFRQVWGRARSIDELLVDPRRRDEHAAG